MKKTKFYNEIREYLTIFDKSNNMKKKKFKKILNLEYYEDNSIPEKWSYKWWPISPENFDNLFLKTFKNWNNYQIHIKWSKKSLEELWEYLINLANYKTVDPDYHDHFDSLDNIKWNSEIIIHHPNSNWKS